MYVCVCQFHFARRWGETESARTRKLQDPATAQLKNTPWVLSGTACMPVCVYAFIYVCKYLDICRYACMYVFMYVSVYVTSIKIRENFWQAQPLTIIMSHFRCLLFSIANLLWILVSRISEARNKFTSANKTGPCSQATFCSWARVYTSSHACACFAQPSRCQKQCNAFARRCVSL